MSGQRRPDDAVTGLPAGLTARPRDERRGLPIPPVNVHDGPDGPRVDFTTLNTTTSTELALARRCSLCGDSMAYWVAFLGGPRAAELLRYTDPPGHPECMTAALSLCPHIALARHRRARADRPGGGMIPSGSHGEKPDRYVLGITRSYRTDFVPLHGFSVHLPAPFKSVQEYEYGPDGRLSTTPRTR
jgi:hypothetical protein